MRNTLRPVRSFLFIFCTTLIVPLQAAERPNVLLIYADDLGYGDLGCTNPDSKIPTPHLDRLAAEGMLFTDGHSSSGVCTPSRYAMLTGRFHWRKFYGIVNAFGESVFSPERLTLPEMLQEKGYHTAAIGKWHLGWGWEAYRKPGIAKAKKKGAYGPEAFDWTQPIPNGPTAHGFDLYFGDNVINFPPYAWIENDRVTEIPTRMMNTKTFKPIKEGNWECRPGPMVEGWDPYENIPLTTKKGVDYIQEQAKTDEPFFLYFAFPSPHAPIIPNDEFDGKSAAGPYGDFVYETDDAVGRLIQALKESGQYDNTVIIFSADNGSEAYAYARELKYGHWSSQPFRGVKQDIYEGGHHVPFLVRWPGMTKAGSVCEALVSQVDIMATLAEHLDVSLPMGQAEDSLSFLPLLGGEGEPRRQAVVHSTWQRTGFGLRQGDWVLIDAKNGYSRKPPGDWEQRHGIPKDDDGPVELYNLKKDIMQKHNLASQYPERVKAMQEALSGIRAKGMAGR